MIEILVAMIVFALVSYGMYSVMFSSSRAGDKSTDISEVSADARRGFNRLVRDTRESQAFDNPSSTEYTVEIDFDGDGTIEPTPADPSGNYERLTFAFVVDPTNKQGTITVSDGSNTEVLMDHVDCIRKADNTCFPVFTFSSSRLLDLDTTGPTGSGSPDGVTSAFELDVAPTIGNNNGILDGDEINFIDRVSYAMTIKVNKNTTNFYGEAQLRNRR
jgi:type II secretory pathway pseudopilin PulG